MFTFEKCESPTQYKSFSLLTDFFFHFFGSTLEQVGIMMET